MNKGLIICGYPGVGKSSVAGLDNCIDLESSLFHYHHYQWNGIAIPDDRWVGQYCNVAIDLANQGFVVLISTHSDVLHYLFEQKANAVIFAPSLSMEDEWIARLLQRFETSYCHKDWRAYMRAKTKFKDDISNLANYGFPVYHPDYLPYDFRDYVHRIQTDLIRQEMEKNNEQ